MTISVRYFASLRESMGRADDQIAADMASTVSEVWANVSNGAEMPANILCSINMEYVDAGHSVQDGDEVAFFPPVTGG
jgi:molybdopterin synthase sulfur carrier subunit